MTIRIAILIVIAVGAIIFVNLVKAQPVQAPVVTTFVPGEGTLVCTYTNGVRYCTRY